MHTFKLLEVSSGLKLNKEKSILFPLGPPSRNTRNFYPTFGVTWSTGPITLLGITFTNDSADLFKLNFPPKLSRLKSLLGLWSNRDLTPIGKVTIVKTLGLSQLVYLFQILPNPPQNIMKDLEKIIFNFIWNGKPDKIGRSTMIGTLSSGGLKVTHIFSFIHSLKCTWVKRYLDEGEGFWKLFFNFYLQSYGQNLLFQCNYKIEDVSIENAFIRDVSHAWSQYSFKIPENFGEEIIWNNTSIKIDNQIIVYNFMWQKGVKCIKDLFDHNNRPLTLRDFKEKYNLDYCPFTTYYGIISSIPRLWKDNLDTANPESVDMTFNTIQHVPSVSKHVYSNLIQSISSCPKAKYKWDIIFNITTSHWENIFQAPFHSVRDSKVQYLQFRFIHRIIGTNVFLHKIGKTDNPRCSFCGRHEETILHLFWECHIVSNFILDTEQAIFGNQFMISKRDMCFGYNFSTNHPYNFLIFHLKFFIYSRKMANEKLCCNDFLFKLKFVLKIEKNIQENKGRNFIHFTQLKDAFSFCSLLFN